jgi:hypothetical protein
MEGQDRQPSLLGGWLMALPALTVREKQLYKDTMTVYRQVIGTDGNVTGWSIAPLSDTDSTPLSNVACNFHRTPTFDYHSSDAGMSKRVNIDTSNLITCQYQIGLRPTDKIYITTRYGDSDYQKVIGAPEREVLVPCTCVYLTPDAPIPSGLII